MVLSLLLGNQRFDEMEMPQVPHQYSFWVQGKYRAVSAKVGGCSSGSSSSSGGERVKSTGIQRQRFVSCVKNSSGTEMQKRSEGVQGELAGEEGRVSKKMGTWMETDEEVHGKKELGKRKKKLRKQLRALEKFTDMEQRLVDEQKEKWQQEFQNIEQTRNDLLPHTKGCRQD